MLLILIASHVASRTDSYILKVVHRPTLALSGGQTLFRTLMKFRLSKTAGDFMVLDGSSLGELLAQKIVPRADAFSPDLDGGLTLGEDMRPRNTMSRAVAQHAARKDNSDRPWQAYDTEVSCQ